MHSIRFQSNNGTSSTVFFDENAFEFFTPRLSTEEAHRLMRDLAAEITLENSNLLYVRHILQYKEQEKICFDVYLQDGDSFAKKTFSISERAKECRPAEFTLNSNNVPLHIKELAQKEYVKNNSSEVQKRAATLLDERKLLSNAKFSAPLAPVFSAIQKDIDALWESNPDMAKQELRSAFGDRFEKTIAIAERDRDSLLAQLKEKQFARLAALEQRIASMKQGAPDNYSGILESFVTNQLNEYKIPTLLGIVKNHLESEKSRLEKFSAPTAFTELLAYYIMFKRTHHIITHVNHLLCWAIYTQAQAYFDSIKHDKEKRAEYNRHFAAFGLSANDCGQLPTLAAMYESKLNDCTLQTASLFELQRLLRDALNALGKSPCAEIITKGLAEFQAKIVADHQFICADAPKTSDPTKIDDAKAAENPWLMGRLVSASISLGKATVGAATSGVLNYFNINFYLEKFTKSFSSAPEGATLFYEVNPFSWKENLTAYIESNVKAKADIFNYVCQNDKDWTLKSQVAAKLTTPVTQEKLAEMDCLMDIIESRLTKSQAVREKKFRGKTTQANIANPQQAETFEERLTKLYGLKVPEVSLVKQAENARTMLIESHSASQLIEAMAKNIDIYKKCSSDFLSLRQDATYSQLVGKPRDFFTQFTNEIESKKNSMEQDYQSSTTCYQNMYDSCRLLVATNALEVNSTISANKKVIEQANTSIEAQRRRAVHALRALKCFIAEQTLGAQISKLEKDITDAETLLKNSGIGLEAMQHDISPLLTNMRINVAGLKSAVAFVKHPKLIDELNAENPNLAVIETYLADSESTQADHENKRKHSQCLFDLLKVRLELKQLQAEKLKMNDELSHARRQTSASNVLTHSFKRNIENTDSLETLANQSAIDVETSLNDLSKNTLSETNLADFNKQLAGCKESLEVTRARLKAAVDAKNLICQSMNDVRSPSPQLDMSVYVPNPYGDHGTVKLCNDVVQIITNLDYWQSQTTCSSLPFFGGKRLDRHVVPKHIRLLNRCIREHGRHNSPETAQSLLLKLQGICNIALQNPTKKGRRTATKRFYPLLQGLTTLEAINRADANRSWESALETWKSENGYLHYQPAPGEKAAPRRQSL